VARAKLAAAERGPTAEERAQAKARLDSAVAQERLARADAERYAMLFQDKAVSRQAYEQAQTAARQAEARRKELEEAYQRTEAGTPKEELEQARQAHLQAKAALDLVRAGSRAEDVQAARAARDQQQQALEQLLRGTRAEDLRAGEARLEQQEQALRTLRSGSRVEEVAAAEAHLAQAQATLAALQAGSRKEQIAQARAAAAAAQATARGSQASLAERVVRAPHAAVVQSIPVATGDLVNAGSVLARLDNPDDLWLRVYVPESELAKVTVNGEATLQIDGIPEPVTAYVESIATRGEFTPANLQTPEERGKQVFAVRLRLRKPDARIKAGMYTTVKRVGSWEP
jgi:multidrug resistance efflux pump